MIKLDGPKRDIELDIIEAKIELAVLEYENYKWLHPRKTETKRVLEKCV